MKQYLIEIVRQKWRLLTVILTLLLLNVALSIAVSSYQLPALAKLQNRWSELRQQSASGVRIDPTALHQQGAADLNKLKEQIPEKREFARVLSDLYESAESCAVDVGALSYKPTPIKEEALLSYQLSLSVSGDYAAVKSYLADLQENQEMIVVDTVTFSNGDLFVENVVMNLGITVFLREGA